MIQQLHFWVSTQKYGTLGLEHISVHLTHSSIFYNSQNVEGTQVSMDRWMDRKDVVRKCPKHNSYSSALKEILMCAATWVKFEDAISWSQEDNCCMLLLSWSS
jgi:hypothetical protein